MDHKNNKTTNASVCLDDAPSHTNEGIISGISLFLRVSRNSGGFAEPLQNSYTADSQVMNNYVLLDLVPAVKYDSDNL